MKKLHSLAIALLMFISISVIAQKNWTGATSTSWGTATNWSPNGVPTASDVVNIPSAPANQPLISGITAVCNTLNVYSGATLSISGTSVNNATLTVSQSSMISGTISIAGSITKTGKLITKNINWGSGSSISPYLNSMIEVTGNWFFSPGSNVSMGLCSVQFTGSDNSLIYSNSGVCNFQVLTLNKTSPATVTVDPASTSSLNITSTLTINPGNSLISAAPITTIFKGNVMNSGIINFSAGNQGFERTSGTQILQTGLSDFFNDVTINSGGTVQLSAGSNMTIKGNFNLNNGVFDPNNNTVFVSKNWNNNVGPSAFLEGTGTVTFNGGSYHQYCSNEEFNILHVNKAAGEMFRIDGTSVVCANYDWTAGAIEVLNGGSFTANDLVDNLIYGTYFCNTGCTINLTRTDGNIHLCGSMYIYGGTVNLHGGNGFWLPWNSHDAHLTMTGGTLNLMDQSLYIRTDSVYNFTYDITGGAIRTAKGYTCNRSDFNPTGGTIELFGPGKTNLSSPYGSFNNLLINKASTNDTVQCNSIIVRGSLVIQSGTLKGGFIPDPSTIYTSGNISVNNGGTLLLDDGDHLLLTGGRSLTVDNGGFLRLYGTEESRVKISRNGTTSPHEIQINGTISANYATFEHNYGINIWGSATIDPLNAFNQCTFQNGASQYLLISNSQEVMIRNASFPVPASTSNVWKNNNAGRVNFRDASGIFAGAAFEQDPYNRIDWTTSQPGLWTGAVSTDWHTAGNWDDLNIPTSATNVTIPSGLANMPVVSSAAAYCNGLNLNGSLTIQDKIVNVNGNMKVNGSLIMNNFYGELQVSGSVQWFSGSSANISEAAAIAAFGDWTVSSGANVNFSNGKVVFLGTVSSSIKIYSANCSFHDISVRKSGSASLSFSSVSTESLKVNDLEVLSYSSFNSSSAEDILVTGNLLAHGIFQQNLGSLVLGGENQIIVLNINNYFNHLVFNQSGNTTINAVHSDNMKVNGNLSINSGIFIPGNVIIVLGGNWVNNAGPSAFDENSCRVIFTGSSPQYCSSEQFDILEVNKPIQNLYLQNSDSITCQTYDWTSGGLYVAGNARFIAYDLEDNGIAGYLTISDGFVDLHQDATQRIDLIGSLTITSGELKVYGGSDQSFWGSYGDASLQMNGGILEFMDKSILIQDLAPCTFTSNINGGTIRNKFGFMAQSPGFNPTGGTVELYGNNNNMLSSGEGGYFYNILINKNDFSSRVQLLNTQVNNLFLIEDGLAEISPGFQLTCLGNVAVNQNGWLAVSSGTMKMAGNKVININSGGTLTVQGSSGSPSTITSLSPSTYYSLNIHSGAFFTSQDAIFEYLAGPGVNIAAGAWVNPYNTMMNCTFRYGQPGTNALLTIDNDQDLVIEGASFPGSPGCQYNARKTSDQGSITFINAQGAFTGETFENDPNDRIYWTPNRKINLSYVYLQGLYDDYGMMRQAQDENGPHFPAGVADHVTIELHHETYYSYVVFTVNDVPLNTDGTITVEVPATLQGNYRITILHRNSIEITTSSAIAFPGGNVNYSFDMPGKVYGNNLVYFNGRYVIYGGDVNLDGLIDSGDMIDVDNDVADFSSGYLPTDVNGDGLVDSTDMILVDNNASNFIGAILP